MARRIAVAIVGDASSLERSFQQAQKSTQKFNREISQTNRGVVAGSGAFKSLGRSVAFASGTFLGAAGLTAGVKASISAASDLNEQISKTDIVFGQSAAGIEDWSKTTADAFGLSRRQALTTASTFGALFKPIGIIGPEAAKQSRALTELGADLAAFYNTDVASALDAIRSGLVGESEPLRQYGVLLSETRVQQQALVDTGKKHASQLTTQEKALARIKIIFQDTTTAQGNFKETQGGLAGQTKTLQANIDDLSASLGEHLIPGLTTAVDWTNRLIDSFHKYNFSLLGLARGGKSGELFKRLASGKSAPQGPIGKPGPPLPPVEFVPPGLQGPTPTPAEIKRTVEQRNAWWDAMIGRKIDRVQDVQSLQGQLASLRSIAALIKQRLAITKDITRQLNLEDLLLSVTRQEAGVREQQQAVRQQMAAQAEAAAQAARDEALAWADFAVEKAAATKGLKDDLKAAQARLKLLEKQAGVGKKTAAEARAIWEQQQEINRIRKEMGRAEKGFATRFKPMNVSQFIQSLGLGLSVEQMKRLAAALSQLGPRGTLPKGRSAAFAGAGGVTVNGDVHISGVQNAKQMEAELHKRAHRRAAGRRGN